MGKGCLNDIQPIMKCMNDLFTSCFTFQKLKDLEALYMIINIYVYIYGLLFSSATPVILLDFLRIDGAWSTSLLLAYRPHLSLVVSPLHCKCGKHMFVCLLSIRMKIVGGKCSKILATSI